MEYNILYLCDKRTNAHLLYKYAQSHIIILPQNVSVAPLTIIRVSYNKNAINIQIIVQKCIIKPLHVALYCSIVLRMVIM